MRIASFILIAAGLSLAAACGERAPDGATLLTASRLYVSPEGPPIDAAAVLIVDGKVAAAGPAKDMPARGATRLTGCDGGIVVAGFQNSHVHFTEAKFADAAAKPAGELGAAMDDMLNRHGFTTVVDTASDLANTVVLRDRIERGEVPGPRILTAGSRSTRRTASRFTSATCRPTCSRRSRSPPRWRRRSRPCRRTSTPARTRPSCS